MKLTLIYFASIREALGLAGETVETSAATLAQLRDELIARGGGYADVLGSDRPVRMALDRVMSEEAAAPRDGCEVAFFPPVTGG